MDYGPSWPPKQDQDVTKPCTSLRVFGPCEIEINLTSLSSLFASYIMFDKRDNENKITENSGNNLK